MFHLAGFNSPLPRPIDHPSLYYTWKVNPRYRKNATTLANQRFRDDGVSVFSFFFSRYGRRKTKKSADAKSRGREQRVVDARGGNSEAGGTRLAVLKLRPGPDWPCERRTLSHRSAFGKLARCRISETLAEGFRARDGFPLLFPLSSPFRSPPLSKRVSAFSNGDTSRANPERI